MVERGIIVVCANGNSDIGTILPPIDYIAVGGFNDRGRSARTNHVPYPGEPFGFNGDGHFRPDIRAPRTRIMIPYCEGEPDAEKRSYYSGTSAASTLVAGVCMHLLSRYPNISTLTLRNALSCFGDQLMGDINTAPCINVKRTVKAISQGYKSDHKIESQLVDKAGVVERAINLSRDIRKKDCTRENLWRCSYDPDPQIRKIAVYLLGSPVDQSEREELTRWIPLAESPHWSIRWCVVEFLSKIPDLPQLEKTNDPEQVPIFAQSVLKLLES